MNWDIFYNGSWIESFTMPDSDVIGAKRYVSDRYSNNGDSTMEIAPTNDSANKFKVW